MSITSKYAKERWIDNGRGRICVGAGEGEFRPYDLLYGALSACYFLTLESLCEKMKITYEEVNIAVDGRKRAEKVATLEFVEMKIEARGVEDQEKFLKACELAGKYCSIHATIAEVSQMHHEVTFL